jgi:hypothetical protein
MRRFKEWLPVDVNIIAFRMPENYHGKANLKSELFHFLHRNLLKNQLSTINPI